jgi:hypothetical protein
MNTELYVVEECYNGGDLSNALRQAAELVESEKVGEDNVLAIQWLTDDSVGHTITVVYRNPKAR